MFHCDVVDLKTSKISLERATDFIESHKCGASLFFIGIKDLDCLSWVIIYLLILLYIDYFVLNKCFLLNFF